MHCHDVLCIAENASLDDINTAYDRKAESLALSESMVSREAFELKQHELITAKEECLAWHSKPTIVKIGQRTKSAISHHTHTNRMYSVCFGPCTCTDMCCGAACDGSSVNPPTCCEQSTGSQTCPIICDAIIWAPGVIWVGYHILRFLFTAIADAVRNHSRAKEERIRTRIAELRSRVSTSSQQRTELERQLGVETKDLEYLSAFTTLFSSMGVNNTTTITNGQENKVRALRNQILTHHDEERSLHEEISSNERRL